MMTVTDLIAWLGKQPQDLPVIAYNDGMPCSPSLSILETNSALLIESPVLLIGGSGEPVTASEFSQNLAGYDGQLPVWVYDDGGFEDAGPVVVEAGGYYQLEKIDPRSIVILTGCSHEPTPTVRPCPAAVLARVGGGYGRHGLCGGAAGAGFASGRAEGKTSPVGN